VSVIAAAVVGHATSKRDARPQLMSPDWVFASIVTTGVGGMFRDGRHACHDDGRREVGPACRGRVNPDPRVPGKRGQFSASVDTDPEA
jgi:hypothetical protein